MSGSIPFAAFVKFERAFSRFAKGRDLSSEETSRLIANPLKTRFGLFLTVWDEAEKRIQAVLDPEEKPKAQTTASAGGAAPTRPKGKRRWGLAISLMVGWIILYVVMVNLGIGKPFGIIGVLPLLYAFHLLKKRRS